MSYTSNCGSLGRLICNCTDADSLRHLRSSDSLKYCVYYGKDRTKCLGQLDHFALVITTYSVVRLDWKTWLAEPENPLTLHATKWTRVVLDEGV